MRAIFLVIAVAFAASPAAGEETRVGLKRAPGLHEVEVNCGGCHSLDYISMNSTFLDAAGWDAEVTKMINAFGAPIDPADAKIIADYLRNNYGPIETKSILPVTAGTPSQTEASRVEARVPRDASTRPASVGRINTQRRTAPSVARSTGSSPSDARHLPSNQQVTRQRPDIISMTKPSWAEAMINAQRIWPGRSLCDDGGYRIRPCDLGAGGGGDGGGGGGGD